MAGPRNPPMPAIMLIKPMDAASADPPRINVGNTQKGGGQA